MDLLQSNDVAWWTEGRQIIHGKFQERRKLIPPFFKVSALFAHAILNLAFSALSNRVVDVDKNLVEDLGKRAHLHEARG